ncbi:MAG TPA: hypothetical protein VMB48_03410, partial [Steroidobacteraceae bacterium]|nr:hypothetical protein [Steroidobacteraceae bacterium]
MARIAPVLLLGLAAGAQAQGLRLPTLPLVPQLPIVSQLPAAPQLSVLSPSPSDPNLLRALGTQTDIPPAQQRRQRVRELLRRYRNVLEADPAGEAMVRGDVVALSPADADLATARTAGFSVEGVRILDGLDARIVVLRAPAGIDTAAALARLRALVPGGNFDFN